MRFIAPIVGVPGVALGLVSALYRICAAIRKDPARRPLVFAGVGILTLASLPAFLACAGEPPLSEDAGPAPTSTSVSQVPAAPSPPLTSPTPMMEPTVTPAETPRSGPAPVPITALTRVTPVAAAVPSAVTPTATPVPARATPVPTALPARAAPVATDEEVQLLVAGNSAFALDLYRTLGAGDGNLFFSPYSISQALAMTYAGARGETERQMADTLHFMLSQDTLHSAFNSLYLDLDSRGGGKGNNDPSGFKLNVANSLWAQHDHRFLDEFFAVIAENYGAGVRPVDFRGEPEESRLRINEWVARETGDRIRSLIPPETFERQPPALALVNAIYFNAAWLHEFRDLPRPIPFHLIDGGEVAVQMMKRTSKSGYASGDGYQAVDLEYKFTDMSMTIVLPDSGNFEAFESSLDDDLLGRVLEDVETRGVALTMPKFEFSSTFALADTLRTMGMSNAFDDRSADFSGMDDRSCAAGDVPCLAISKVIHKAFVSVDEEGTEAAAVTAVLVFPLSAAPGPPVEVTVDRPFIFLIRDKATGTILFMGRVLDPSS